MKRLVEDRALLSHIEDKARSDGQYAIALAIFELAHAHREAALALDRLGFNEHRQPNGSTGCFEEIAVQLRTIVNLKSRSEEERPS